MTCLMLSCFYVSAIGVRKPSDDFLVKCSCHECLDATACGCQDVSEIADGDGNRVFAYTRSVGLLFLKTSFRIFCLTDNIGIF